MGDQAWRMLRLNNRMPLDEAARRVSALHFATEALSAEERNLLDIAEGLLELVHVGAAVNTCTPRPSGPTPARVQWKRPTQLATRTSVKGRVAATQRRPPGGVGRAALQAVFDRYQIVDMLVPGPAASGADDPGSDLSLLLAVP